MYKIVDLFSGIGGFSYAAEQIVGGFETVAFVERDQYCQKVLRKHWHDVPIYSDIRSFNGKEYKDADIVVGGFPCQPWSVAGSQRGSEDDRDLWHEMVRIIEDIRPRWVIGENVSGFVTMPMGLRRSLADLESIGYKAIPYLIPAAAVDAKHRRMRCWVVGHTEHNGSSATSFRRGNNQIDGGSTQGTNKASELEGASGQEDNGYIQTNIFDLMANTNNAGDRTPTSGVDTEQQTTEQEWEQQSQSELSRQRDNVADTNDKGVRARINGSDNDLQKEGRGGRDDRTTSRTDVGSNTKTAKNGEMGLSEKGDVPYTNSKGLQGFRKHGELERESSKNESTKKSVQGRNGADFRREPITWQPEPNVGRVAHGVSNRVHRLRCLGNSIVPQVVARIFYAIKEADNDSKV
jgi:DNA-cytosine methyltransferase